MFNKKRAILINDTSIENHYGCKFVVNQIEMQCEMHNITIIHRIMLNEDWREKKHISKIKGADLVLVNGEGSLHSSNNRAKILSTIAPYCKNNKIPCFLLNSVYQNNNKEIADNVRNFDLIFVRETASQNELLKANIESKVVPDLIFAYSDLFNNVGDELTNRNYILFSDSTLDKTSIHLYNLHQLIETSKFITLRPLEASYAKPYINTSLSKRFKKIVKAIIVKMKKGKPLRNNDVTLNPSELSIMRKIYSLNFNKSNFLDLIKNADLIITGRFHLACLGLLAGKSVYAIASNTHKIEALFKDIGIEKNILSLDQGVDEIISLKEKSFDNDKVRNYALASKVKIDKMFEEILIKTNQNDK